MDRENTISIEEAGDSELWGTYDAIERMKDYVKEIEDILFHLGKTQFNKDEKKIKLDKIKMYLSCIRYQGREILEYVDFELNGKINQ